MQSWKELFLRKDSIGYSEDGWPLLRLFCENSFLLCILIAAMTRIYFYIYPKDLWLDEAMIALAIDKASWLDIFKGKFSYYQSCPIGFAIINKIINIYTGYSQYALYIIPTILGISILVLLCRFCICYDRNKLFVFICISIFAVCKNPLYYSSEFKHYIYEMLVAVILLFIFFNDLRKKNCSNIFTSFKYPMLFIVCLVFSNTSIFFAISLCFTMYIYVLCQKESKFVKTTSIFVSRYFIFGVFCLVYYLFYLKNEETSRFMQSYWGKYFIPHSLDGLSAYAENVFIPFFIGLLRTANIKYFSFILLPFFIAGFICIYRKNKYEFLSLFLVFVIATVAAFGFYPFGHAGVIGGRLSSYLVPVIIFIASYGLYKMLYFLYIKMQLKMCCVWFLCVGMIVFVVNTNIAYLSSDIRCQQTFSFFNEIKKKYTEGDFVCIYKYTAVVLKYWMLINNEKFDCIVFCEKGGFEDPIVDIQNDIGGEEKIFISDLPDEFAGKKRIFIVYSHTFYDESVPQRAFNFFKKLGYSIQIERDNGSELHILTKK